MLYVDELYPLQNNSKAAGIYPLLVAEKLETFPLEMLDMIKWGSDSRPDRAVMVKDITTIVNAIIAV